ncbi:DExH-box ATP-dependent RNA helicase DExH14 [Porphyridium purpureum]|uniref:DExH-box ATP-dependent RNA helicase DExH14 n=1 Tax=Porphyridium purpureum TaxID=35688 RepID=A0A5J4YYQ3_PORPP|nr:DExH-box ATP-dependent RNA helicase DExH14 [Porphyridium purpureum]|eukprot:POR9324..scf209_3
MLKSRRTSSERTETQSRHASMEQRHAVIGAFLSEWLRPADVRDARAGCDGAGGADAKSSADGRPNLAVQDLERRVRARRESMYADLFDTQCARVAEEVNCGLSSEEIGTSVRRILLEYAGSAGQGDDDVAFQRLQHALFDLIPDFEFVQMLVSHHAAFLASFQYRETMQGGKKVQNLPQAGATLLADSTESTLSPSFDLERGMGSVVVSQSQGGKTRRLVDPNEVRKANTLGSSALGHPAAPLDPIRKLELEISALPADSGGVYRDKLGTVTLPAGSMREVGDGYESITVPAHSRPKLTEAYNAKRVIAADVLSALGRRVFRGVISFNPVQSRVFDCAVHSDENMLVCAPTGAGKTNVALLTILRELQKHAGGESAPNNTKLSDLDFKIVYVAPMKALAAEVSAKFAHALEGICAVRELSGDIQLTRAEIRATQIIVTTPEKWDVISRKNVGSARELTSSLRLLLIDEVHLLHEERGAVLESIVARTLRAVESEQRVIRVVALSATLPNYDDVAQFLHVNPARGLFFFDATYRPVPLEQVFIGITQRDPKLREAAYGKLTFDRVAAALRADKQAMVFVHARKQTARAARELLELAADEAQGVGIFLPIDEDPPVMPTWAMREISALKSGEATELAMRGIGIHHAGLLRGDRSTVERLFGAGALRVICCTSTLAWGVNLPAHTVIIKGTQVYDSQRGTQSELSMLDVMQIFGRAGRPQFDVCGTGVILTTHAGLAHYLRMLTCSMPIESRLLDVLPDHLNAEVVAGSVRSIRDAVSWLSYTYLAVRMVRNPLAYGAEWSELQFDPELQARRERLARAAAHQLDAAKMVRFSFSESNANDQANNESIVSLDLGRIASHWYVSYATLLHWIAVLSATSSETDVLHAVALASEFEAMKVRDEELDELVKLKKSGCFIQLPAGMALDSKEAKVILLIQARISRRTVVSFSLQSDMTGVNQNAPRLLRACFEVALARGWPQPAAAALDLARAFEHAVWPFQSPLRQLADKPLRFLRSELCQALEEPHLADQCLELEALLNLPSAQLSSILGNDSLASQVRRAARSIPRLAVNAKVVPITRSVLRFSLALRPDFEWSDRLSGSGDDTSAAESFVLVIEDGDDDRIYHSERVAVRRRLAKSGAAARTALDVELFVPVFDPPSSVYLVRTFSERWLGGDAFVEVPLHDMVLPSRPNELYTPLLDLRPLPTAAAHDKLYAELGMSFFNPIQTQLFHTLFHTDANVLVGVPAGSGKTVLAELAMLRALSVQASSGHLDGVGSMSPSGGTASPLVVYITPVHALARERARNWKHRFRALGLRVAELHLDHDSVYEEGDGLDRGDQSDKGTDLRVSTKEKLESADIVITTPDSWDAVTRKPVSPLRRLSCVIVDEAHLIGGLGSGGVDGFGDGATLEAVVVRMRRWSMERSNRPSHPKGLRFVALCASLDGDSARDLAEFFGVTVSEKTAAGVNSALSNFRPSARPVPLELHLESVVDASSYHNQLASMNRMVYAALVRYTEPHTTTPVLVFVPSRRDTHVTAFELVKFAAADTAHAHHALFTPLDLAAMGLHVYDRALAHALEFGCAIYHSTLCASDRRIVETLFRSGSIRVVICTASLAWSSAAQLPAQVVIVKGTQCYDITAGRMREMDLANIVQMVGCTGAARGDSGVQHEGSVTRATAIVLTTASKRAFYQKFLYEPLPIESALHLKECLHNQINAALVSGSIYTPADAVNYLTGTLLFRRLQRNPSYYGLEQTSDGTGGVVQHCKALASTVFRDLAQAGCVVITNKESGEKEMDGNSEALRMQPTVLGELCSSFCLSYKTAALLKERLTPRSAPKQPALSVASLFSLSMRCEELHVAPVRVGESALLAALRDRLLLILGDEVLAAYGVPVSAHANDAAFRASAVKSGMLLLSRMTRTRLPNDELAYDERRVRGRATQRLLPALVLACAELSSAAAVKCALQLRRAIHNAYFVSDQRHDAGHVALTQTTRLPNELWLIPDFQGGDAGIHRVARESNVTSVREYIEATRDAPGKANRGISKHEKEQQNIFNARFRRLFVESVCLESKPQHVCRIVLRREVLDCGQEAASASVWYVLLYAAHRQKQEQQPVLAMTRVALSSQQESREVTLYLSEDTAGATFGPGAQSLRICVMHDRLPGMDLEAEVPTEGGK